MPLVSNLMGAIFDMNMQDTLILNIIKMSDKMNLFSYYGNELHEGSILCAFHKNYRFEMT